MALAGFDPEYYLEAKLTALMDSGSPDWDADTLEVILGVLGYTRVEFMESVLAGCGLTPEEHYLLYGWSEGLSPNPYFDAGEYTLAKAASLFESGGYESPEAAREAFEEAWPGDPYEHYLLCGASEGINPSNDFDASDYLAAKLAALLADPKTAEDWLGKTVEDLEAAFEAAGLTPLTHYLLYGRGEGLSAPEVPEEERVGAVDDSGGSDSGGNSGGSDSGGSSGGSGSSGGGSSDSSGETFTLSGGGIIQGTERDDTFTGGPGEIGNVTIAAKGGDDTLILEVDHAHDHSAALTSTDLETALICANDDLTIDLVNAIDLETVWSDNSAGRLTLFNVDLSVTAGIMGTDAGLVVNFSADAGDADEASLILSEVSAGGTVTADNIEILNVSGRDGASEIIIDADALETLKIEGSQDLTLTLTDASRNNLTQVNAAGAAGDVTVALETTPRDISLAGGSGDDTFQLEERASLAEDDAINGGRGSDTLVLYASANAFVNADGEGDLNVFGVETLSLFTDGEGNDDDEIDFDVFTGAADFSSVMVTATADGDGVTLTDTRASAFFIRNTDDGAAGGTADEIATVSIDLNDTSSGTDAISIALINREKTEDMAITALEAAGVETITLTGDPMDDEADSDITLATLTAGDLETLSIAGAGNITLGSGSALTAETINGASATGNLDLTLGSADQTITGGLGDDIFRFGSGMLTKDDTIDGGGGEDTLVITDLAAGADKTIQGISNVESIDYTESAAADADATLDLSDHPGLDEFSITLESTSADILTFENIQGSRVTARLDGITGDSEDTLAFTLESDGNADEFHGEITTDGSDFQGTLNLHCFETITLDFTGTGDRHQLDDIDAAFAETITFTNDDAWAKADYLYVRDNAIKDGATIDLTGWGQNIGDVRNIADSNDFDSIKGAFGEEYEPPLNRCGITFDGAGEYTVLLSDGRTGAQETYLDLGSSNEGVDIIRFADSAAGDTNDIGAVVIDHFNDGESYDAENTSKIDLSAYGVEAFDELNLICFHGWGIDSTVIMSKEEEGDFEGAIILAGVYDATKLLVTADNFIFA